MLQNGRWFYTCNLREETDICLFPDEIKLQLISRHVIHTLKVKTLSGDTGLIRWIQTQMARRERLSSGTNGHAQLSPASKSVICQNGVPNVNGVSKVFISPEFWLLLIRRLIW